MSDAVGIYLLDSGPLGLASNPRASAEGMLCNEWIAARVLAGDDVLVPEAVEYEVRRELARAGKAKGLAKLDALAANLGTVPITRPVWRRAAELWAKARKEGVPTARDEALDVDVIIAATAQLVAAETGRRVAVVTGNAGHLSRFVEVADWKATP